MSTSTQEYRVELEAYSGPLDLLLYLVRRHEVDLYDIPIAQLTEQYMDHLRRIQQVDVELAGEFLVMAATLLEIKSQMLVPRGGDDPVDDSQSPEGSVLAESDPRYELVQQLLAYKQFKDAAMMLEERRQQWQRRYAYQPSHGSDRSASDDSSAAPMEVDLEDVQMFDLCQAFARILDSIGQTEHHEIIYDDTPIALHAEDILDQLQHRDADGGMALHEIIDGRVSRGEMIGLFLATLELVLQRKICVIQEAVGGEIYLELVSPDQQAPTTRDLDAGWVDPQTGERSYEWPSEEAQLAAAHRLKKRGTYEGKISRISVEDEIGDDGNSQDDDSNIPSGENSDSDSAKQSE